MTCLLTGRIGFSEPVQIFIYSVGLFACCMACHGEVYRLKPDPAFLTSFYLVIAAGGALGGIFVALIAPRVFPDYFELHWGLLACGILFLLVLAGARSQRVSAWQRLGVGCRLGSRGRNCGLALAGPASLRQSASLIASRNFYGVLNVFGYEHQQPEPNLRELMHGKVAHGMQFLQMPARGMANVLLQRRKRCRKSLEPFSRGNAPSGNRRRRRRNPCLLRRERR